MAETVQYYLERMIPELEDLEVKGIFTKAEIKSIVKKRTEFEYALKRRVPKKNDFLRYIEYEMNLEALRSKRRERLGKTRHSISDHAGIQRIHFLFERLCTKFHGDLTLWLAYIDFVKRSSSSKSLGRIFGRTIQLHPTKAEPWLAAAAWEWEENGNVGATRTLLQRGLRFNTTSKAMWIQYFKLELMFLIKIMERRRLLGIDTKDNVEEEQKTAQVHLGKLPSQEDEANPFNDDQNIHEKSTSSNRFFMGAIPLAVFNNAIAAITKDVSFYLEFLRVYDDFGARFESISKVCIKGAKSVLSSLQTAFEGEPLVQACLSERRVVEMNPSGEEYANALKVVCATYSDLMQDDSEHPLVIESFVKFLSLEKFKCSKESDLNPALARFITAVLEKLKSNVSLE